MKRQSRTNKVASAVFVLMCVATYAVIKLPPVERQAVFAQPEQVREIAGYRQWTKVNAAPQVMPHRVATLCAAPVAAQDNVPDGADNPHRDRYITVYVNAKGRAAMLEQKVPAFPVGSVIVKEKLLAPDSRAPELLTVMIKRPAGYDPANGDWEYLVTDGGGKQITARGKLQSCRQCHLARRDGGYIFRTYLSAEMQQNLK